ncbi:hypothetical protein Sjap_023732 [Stephania japonica]|uniref:Eukaryotic translation initiation factor 3 subunit B n=1 Tax=Stephania japonica TaxID=461633 RepID=A0AAP0HPH6_9MAGN
MVEAISMEEIEEKANRLGIDLSRLDLDSITLPPGQDFGIISDDDEDVLRDEEPMQFESGFGNVIVVDNLPVVPPEKYDKLETVIRKIYGQIGTIRKDGLWMPKNPENQKTVGYCFIEYTTPEVIFVLVMKVASFNGFDVRGTVFAMSGQDLKKLLSKHDLGDLKTSLIWLFVLRTPSQAFHMKLELSIVQNDHYCALSLANGQYADSCFMEAELAREKTNGYKLDKSHIFIVNLFDDIDKYMKVLDKWAPPETKPYTPGENLHQWLMDDKARDQFVIRAGSDTEVMWNDPRQLKPELVYRRTTSSLPLKKEDYIKRVKAELKDELFEVTKQLFEARSEEKSKIRVLMMHVEKLFLQLPACSSMVSRFWTESFVQWSPLGTYLATVHRQGAAVWGGANTFNRLKRYAHPQVKLIDFSPGEKYLVTYSSHEPSNPRDMHRVVLNIFDVRTEKPMRDFKGSADEFAIGGTGGVAGVSWPVFRWGGGKEDKYFARLGRNMISVYETETFSLIDKKSIKVDSVMDFSWSPTDPILALFVPELGGGNQPARVSLVQIPGKEELRQKNLFSVSDCKMYWQSNGDYLAVKVDRYTKTKKSTYTGFELFRIKERDIPIEVLELDNKNDKIIAFAWEPKGHRFAVIHGDSPRPDISFYSMRTAQHTGRVSKLTTLKGKQANALFWSPSGRFILLADIEWDPTGRYVATSVTSVHEMENGFNIWSFSGKLLYRIPRDHFFQFLWRPRPPSLLSPEKEEEIAKNLKKYSKKYEAEDQDVSLLLSEQDREKRRMVQEEWDTWVKKWKQLDEEEKMVRQRLRDGEASDKEEEYEAKEIEVEEVLDVSEEVVIYDEEQ